MNAESGAALASPARWRAWFLRWPLVLLLCGGMAVAGSPEARLAAPSVAPRLEAVADVPILYLTGSPYEMGLQQGQTWRAQIRALLTEAIYRGVIQQSRIGHWNLLAYARQLDGAVPTPLRREMQGIADATGLSYGDVLLLNVVPEVLLLTSGAYRPGSAAFFASAAVEDPTLPETSTCPSLSDTIPATP